MIEIILLVVISTVAFYKRSYLKVVLKKLLSNPENDIVYLIEDGKEKVSNQVESYYKLKAINECLKEDLANIDPASSEYSELKGRINSQDALLKKHEVKLQEAKKLIRNFEEKKESLLLRKGSVEISEQLSTFTSGLNSDNLGSKIKEFEQNLRIREKMIQLKESDNNDDTIKS